ncbi:MAG: hypothetical protein COS49_01900 [Candidatus Portnoybacteria bacterium CG03_land_8_20_14_0_80_41_10]|uniref:Uncharacterized protein n=1 Tax=Candidatus Portnoybacteria bacterium CG03_land_8_20_14_0_80_41_10 TaxID=1974808 RepID=A0A2M7BUD8_9BACT|nr:MAG: hypothetical protein COS49_01900 [Candidatus Portnoybacteria bacterium CG03_land_8_20_14_0_80_41_10]
MDKKEFYLKKIGQRGKIAIWLVDGSKIRCDLDKEFTNFGQHFRFPFIPKYEFWLDKEAMPNERRFFIDHLLVEWQSMREGSSYIEAFDAAGEKERSERFKAGDLKKVCGKDNRPDIKKMRYRLLYKTDGGILIWLVYGRLVRSAFNIDFTQGGHDLVYDFVPRNNVWLDNDVLIKERPYIMLHELYERSLMKRGFDYPKAHRRASKIEWQARHDKRKLKESLALLGIYD